MFVQAELLLLQLCSGIAALCSSTRELLWVTPGHRAPHPHPHPLLGPAWRLHSGYFRTSSPYVEADPGLFPRKGGFQRGARVTRAKRSWRQERGDLNSFSVAITQLMTLSTSLFMLWPVIHRIRRLGQRALKPHPVGILSGPLTPSASQ